MAGGIWTSQNKVRPGAYINFESGNIVSAEVGVRGIATMGLELDWGAEDTLIELTMEDLLTGNSLVKTGLVADDAAALTPYLALENASLLKIYRLNKGGTKASLTTAGGLTVTAKYNGTFGNKIALLITAAESSKFNVEIYADGYLVDKQVVATIAELVNNDFVTFSGTGTLAATVSTLLTGGTNGTMPTGDGLATRYNDYFDLLRATKWHCLALLITTGTIQDNVIAFIREMREDEGKYVQAVIAGHGGADYEGIINNINGVVINDTSISAATFCAWVAGATAGAAINESLTGKIVNDATAIVNPKTSLEITEELGQGHFLLSLNQNGTVKVEKDINSLHTFTTKSYDFSKNRVIRELDEIGSGIENIWETTYLGKVTNNTNGLTLFRSSIISYLTELANNNAIDTFDTNNVVVTAGEDIDSVVASIAIKPLDSMEFLYMTVNIQ